MDDFTPSVFTPFLRRFTDERARDTADIAALYARVAKMHADSVFTGEDGRELIAGLVRRKYEHLASASVLPAFDRALDAILRLETPIFELPPPDFRHLTLKEATDFRRFLRAKEYFHAHEQELVTRVVYFLGVGLRMLAEELPRAAVASPFSVPLITTLREPKLYMQKVINELGDDQYQSVGLFAAISERLYLNTCEASGIIDPQKPNKRFITAYGSDLPVEETARTYFGGTPFLDLFLSPVPLRFEPEDRFSHMHVLGGSGAGKTTLLQNLVLNDLHSNDPPSLVIVDSQGDLINKLSRLALFDPDDGPLADRFVLITPKDIQHPPAINIFDVNQARLAEYDEAAKEQVVAGVIQTFDYLFAGLLGADLTAKQGVFFRFVARLMLALPETLGRTATILDMLALMDDAAPYERAIASQPPIQRQFFERDFKSKTFQQTKEQIRYRLNAILENPTLARLFTAPQTKLDIFETLNKGGIIMVDTAKDFLKGASGHFGRIIISLVLQAVLERAAVPEHRRKPTFLIVDEAAAYFDSNIDDFLTEARKYKCGCVFAHQFLDQATSSLRASLAANTSIKLAAGVSTSDARALAPDMRTTADFILERPRLHFAGYFRGTTENAVSVPVSVGAFEKEPRMSEAAYERMRERNRERVCSSPGDRRPVQAASEDGPVLREPNGSRTANAASGDPTIASEEW